MRWDPQFTHMQVGVRARARAKSEGVDWEKLGQIDIALRLMTAREELETLYAFHADGEN
jgi:hypothetical protein